MQLFSIWFRNKAIIEYSTKLYKSLARDYGRSREYTVKQVEATIQRNSFSSRYSVYAYAMFCSPIAFTTYADQNGMNQNYKQAKQVVADVCSLGHINFRADLNAHNYGTDGGVGGYPFGDGGGADGGAAGGDGGG